MGERDGIDDALRAAMERTRSKLRSAVARARSEDDAHGHARHGDRGTAVADGRHGDAEGRRVDDTADA